MGPRQAKRLDRFAQFALATGRLALEDAAFCPNGAAADTAVYLGSALGGIAFAEAQHERYLAGGLRAVDPSLALAVFGGAGATNLALELGIRGPAVGNSNSCASGAIAIGEAFRLVQSGTSPLALAGGAEAPLAPLTYGAFAVIRAMSTRNDTPGEACRPFDAERDGFVMGEGACVLLLEVAPPRRRPRGPRLRRAGRVRRHQRRLPHHRPPPGRIGGGAGHGARAGRRRRGAGRGGLRQRPRQLHPPGRPGRGHRDGPRLWPHLGRVRVSGTKPLYGHPLGASGAIETAIVALALHHGFLPGTLNHHEASPGSPEAGLTHVPPQGEALPARVGMSNAFGFGGINASLVLRRWDG